MVLPSTGMQPHFSLAVDKSTPHRDTNHAILAIIPVEGKRVAVPIDAPIVYAVSDSGGIIGGSGAELADQIISVMKERLGFEADDLFFIRGNIFYVKIYRIGVHCIQLLFRHSILILTIKRYYSCAC